MLIFWNWFDTHSHGNIIPKYKITTSSLFNWNYYTDFNWWVWTEVSQERVLGAVVNFCHIFNCFRLAVADRVKLKIKLAQVICKLKPRKKCNGTHKKTHHIIAVSVIHWKYLKLKRSRKSKEDRERKKMPNVFFPFPLLWFL